MEVLAMSVTADEKSLTVEDCHLITVPKWPLKVNMVELAGAQTVALPEAVPPIDAGETVICTAVEVLLQPPDEVILLYHVVAVSG